jgi:hypothetical protein
MKRNRIFTTACVVALAITAFSCSKDKDNNNNNTNQSHCYLDQMTDNNVLNERYIYNSSNQVTRINEYSDNGKLQYIGTVKYGSDGKVSSFTLSDTFGMGMYLYTPTYNSDGTLQKTTMTGLGSSSDNYTNEFEYSNGRVSKQTEYYNGSEQQYEEYTYDANGNPTTIKTYINNTGIPDLMSTETREYDSKAIPDVPALFLLNPTHGNHNITKVTKTDNSGQELPDESYSAVYTYTDTNLPQTEKQTYVGGETHNYAYTYNCK